MKEGLGTSDILYAGNWLIELLGCKHVLPFKKKEECLQGQSSVDTEVGRVLSQAQRAEYRATEDYFQALKPKGISPAGFRTCLGLLTPLFLPVSLLQWECLSCACSATVFGKQMTCFLVSQVYR